MKRPIKSDTQRKGARDPATRKWSTINEWRKTRLCVEIKMHPVIFIPQNRDKGREERKRDCNDAFRKKNGHIILWNPDGAKKPQRCAGRFFTMEHAVSGRTEEKGGTRKGRSRKILGAETDTKKIDVVVLVGRRRWHINMISRLASLQGAQMETRGRKSPLGFHKIDFFRSYGSVPSWKRRNHPIKQWAAQRKITINQINQSNNQARMNPKNRSINNSISRKKH